MERGCDAWQHEAVEALGQREISKKPTIVTPSGFGSLALKTLNQIFRSRPHVSWLGVSNDGPLRTS